MRILFAGDHAGFELKKELMEFVRGLGHEVFDMGSKIYDETDDYTDFVLPLAKKVASYSFLSKGTRNEMERHQRGTDTEVTPLNPPLERGDGDKEIRGIVVAGSGQGEIIAMNRIPGARAALFCPCNLELVKASRDHNDSNIFAIGARFCTVEQAKDGIAVWLKTPFSNEDRHIRRLRKIEQVTCNK